MTLRLKNRAGINRKRIFLVFSISIMFTGIIIYRAVEFQILERDSLIKNLSKQREKVVKLVPRRGRILDSKKNELAVSVNVGSVFARPRAIRDINETANVLSSLLGMSTREIKKLLLDGNNFVWLKRQIPETIADEISKLKLPGIEVIYEFKRFYPHRELAAPVIGFTGWDSQGLEGLEFYFDKYLQGEPEFFYTERDAHGQEFLLDPQDVPLAGNDIVLTLDTGIQFVVEEELKKTVEKNKAKNAVAIVMDVKTGSILAMAQYPGFNPNSFKEYPRLRWRNLSISGIYEPGSTFKVFLVAAALQNGIITPGTPVNCENGEYKVTGDIVIHDVKKYSFLTVENVIVNSSNIGAAKIAHQLGKKTYLDFITELGFGNKTGIELPGEEKGLVKPINKITDVDNMIMGFGQGISTTPIQLISAFNAIVNDGVYVEPHIVEKILSPEGNVIYSYYQQEGRRIVTEKVARQVKRMLEKVVEYGTGTSAKIEGYGSAGKTGTSQKIDSCTGAYSMEKFTSFFIGYTPVHSPRVSILIIVDEPEGTPYGGVVAAPAFKNIGERILPLLNVNSEVADDKGQLRITTEVDSGTQNFIMTGAGKESDMKLMPDLKGLSYREVMTLLSRYGISATLTGNGYVAEQTPPPGTPIDSDVKCSVRLSPLI